VGSIAARNVRYQKRFAELLLSHETADLASGWQQARRLGRPVVPMLWRMLDAERSNVTSRVVLLVAAVLAGGPAEDDRLFAFLDRHKPMLPERTMASMLLALGPARPRPVDNCWARIIGPNKEPEPLLELASRLACARFPDASKGVGVLFEGGPGMIGAAVFGGFRVSPPKLRSLWRNPSRHSELFYRGVLLGAGRRMAVSGREADRTTLIHAEELLAQADVRLGDARAAAILLKARAGQLDPGARRPDWQLLQLCATQPASRDALRAWLPAKPLARDEQPERIAVAYALWQPLDKVLREYQQWGADPRISSHVAVALAFRLAAGGGAQGLGSDAPAQRRTTPADGARTAGEIRVRLPDVPEFRFAVWASGGALGTGSRCEDRELRELARLIADGRASREVVRRTCEEALWRWGSHPGLGQWRQERLLIRDLLLAGSKPGLRYASLLRPSQRYFATGLDKSDSFYEVAVELYEFLAEPVLPIPAEYRLR